MVEVERVFALWERQGGRGLHVLLDARKLAAPALGLVEARRAPGHLQRGAALDVGPGVIVAVGPHDVRFSQRERHGDKRDDGLQRVVLHESAVLYRGERRGQLDGLEAGASVVDEGGQRRQALVEHDVLQPRAAPEGALADLLQRRGVGEVLQVQVVPEGEGADVEQALVERHLREVAAVEGQVLDARHGVVLAADDDLRRDVDGREARVAAVDDLGRPRVLVVHILQPADGGRQRRALDDLREVAVGPAGALVGRLAARGHVELGLIRREAGVDIVARVDVARLGFVIEYEGIVVAVDGGRVLDVRDDGDQGLVAVEGLAPDLRDGARQLDGGQAVHAQEGHVLDGRDALGDRHLADIVPAVEGLLADGGHRVRLAAMGHRGADVDGGHAQVDIRVVDIAHGAEHGGLLRLRIARIPQPGHYDLYILCADGQRGGQQQCG